MKRVLVLTVLLLLFSGRIKAQVMSYRPGATVTIDVVFEGKDAAKISTVSVWLNLTTPVITGQDGFQKQWSGQAQKVGNIFQASFTVGENQAAGTYQINQMRAVMDQSAPIDFYYQTNEFRETSFKIDNPKTAEKPKIKSLTVH